MEVEPFGHAKGDKVYNEKYKKVKFIGQGAYGKISLIQEVSTGNYLAMKKFYGD
jgi:hypothetical protein